MHFKGKESRIFIFFVASFCITFCIGITSGEGADPLSLTSEQKSAFEKFKQSVKDKLPNENMKRDLYLIRWLTARNFDVFRAEQFLMKYLKWREDNNMDNIFNENWSDMEQEYPFTVDSRDKDGRPVFIGQFGHWDLRSADVTGRFPRLMRFANRLLEHEEILVQKLQEEGKKVYGVIAILDMDGFNFRQHACPKCLSFIADFYNSFEQHHPEMLDKLFIINNFPLVNMAFRAMLNKINPNTRESAELFSKNKAEYSKVLLRYIDADQLPEKYGGKKTT